MALKLYNLQKIKALITVNKMFIKDINDCKEQ